MDSRRGNKGKDRRERIDKYLSRKVKNQDEIDKTRLLKMWLCQSGAPLLL
jgi:hypothetical protein